MKTNKENLNIVDEVECIIRDKNGNVKKQWNTKHTRLYKLMVALHLRKPNCITDAGMALMAGLILTDVGGTACDYIAIGEGTTAADHEDDTTYTHACESEVKRKAATGTRVTTGPTNDTAQWVATFSSSDSLSGEDDITEVVIANNATAGSGVIILRQVFAAETLDWDAGDTLQITVKVQMMQGA